MAYIVAKSLGMHPNLNSNGKPETWLLQVINRKQVVVVPNLHFITDPRKKKIFFIMIKPCLVHIHTKSVQSYNNITSVVVVVVVLFIFYFLNGIRKIHVVFNYILSKRSQLKNQLNVCHKYSFFLQKKSYITVPRTDPDIKMALHAYTKPCTVIDLNISFRPIAQQINQECSLV